MVYDAHSNFGYSTVLTAPAPALTGTSLTVQAGHGALFPAVPFNCTVWPVSVMPVSSNAEIVRVTNIVGDTLTITRAQEGTAAVAIAVGYQIANTTSNLVFTDIEDSIIQFISAGTTRASASEIVFSNANGVSFGVDGQSVTASVAGSVLALSAGTQSQGSGTISFADSNNVSFGLDNGTLTASAMGVFVVAGTSARSTGGILFQDANSISWGMANLGQITASIDFPSGGGVAISGGTSSQSAGTVVFSNSNGVSFSLDNGTMTASHNGLTSQSNQAASASNGSFTFQTLNFSDANGVTFGTSAGGIVTASVNTAGGGSINFSAGTQSSNLDTIVFSNSNGVSFGLSNGTITASASGGGGAATLSFYENFPHILAGSYFDAHGAGIARLSLSPMPLYANLSFNSVQFNLSGSNSFQSASVSTALTSSNAVNISVAVFSRSVTNSAATNFSNSSIIVTHASTNWALSWTLSQSSSSKSCSFAWLTNTAGGTSSFTISSNSSNFSINGLTNRMWFKIPFATTCSAGEYWLGTVCDYPNVLTNMWRFSVMQATWNANSTNKSALGDTGNGNVNGNNLVVAGLGMFSTSTSGMPVSINLVNDMFNSNIANQGRLYFQLRP